MTCDHAIRLRQTYVGDDCLLLALIDHNRTRAMMQECGVNVESLRTIVTGRNPPDPDFSEENDVLPPCSMLWKVWTEAHWEANSLKMYSVEPEHLLVGLVRDGSVMSKAGRDLMAAGFVHQAPRSFTRFGNQPA